VGVVTAGVGVADGAPPDAADLLLEACGGTAFPATDYFSAPMLTALRLGFRTLQLYPALAAHAGARLFFAPRKKRQPAFRLPSMEVERFDVKGKRVPLYRFGQGKPVLLVHGWESSVARLQDVIGALMEGGYQVVTFDMPAHGQSTARDTDLIEVSAVIKHLARQHGPFEAGIAHSFGGTCLANAIREQVEVKRLVLFAVPVSAMMMIEVFTEFLQLRGVARDRFRARVANRLEPLDVVADLDARRTISSTGLPGLIIHDVDDVIVPFANAVELKQAHDSMRLIATSGLGHTGVIRDKAAIRACVEFVQGATPRPERAGRQASRGTVGGASCN
jgi:pimeloyl-ACP methyl ester carboxylesterase